MYSKQRVQSKSERDALIIAELHALFGFPPKARPETRCLVLGISMLLADNALECSRVLVLFPVRKAPARASDVTAPTAGVVRAIETEIARNQKNAVQAPLSV